MSADAEIRRNGGTPKPKARGKPVAVDWSDVERRLADDYDDAMPTDAGSPYARQGTIRGSK